VSNLPLNHGLHSNSTGDKKDADEGKEIALFDPFRHLFSSTYNTATLLRMQTV
jgi:hypothetical protein